MPATDQLAADRLHSGAALVVQLPDDVGHAGRRQEWAGLPSRGLGLLFRRLASGLAGTAAAGPRRSA